MSSATLEQNEALAQRIYFAAVGAAGAADDIAAWSERVEVIATAIHSGMKAFTRRLNAVQHSIVLSGTVVSVQENPTAEGTGKPLNLYKVTFRADAGSRPDHMWIDKRGGGELFAQARALEGKRAVVTKEQRVQFAGAEPKLDAKGEVVTSPYLASIRAEAGEDGAPSTASLSTAPTAPTAPASAGEAGPLQKLIDLAPASATEVVNLAGEHFNMTPVDVKGFVEQVLGAPKRANGRPVSRTPEECYTVWSAICFARFGVQPAA